MKTALMPFSALCWASKQRSSNSTSGMTLRARAMLLLARRIHSRGSSGGKRLRFIDYLAFAQGRTNHQAMSVSITLDFFRSHDHDIDSGLAGHIAIDRGRYSMAVELSPFDDQQVKIAVRAHRSARRRP